MPDQSEADQHDQRSPVIYRPGLIACRVRRDDREPVTPPAASPGLFNALLALLGLRPRKKGPQDSYDQ